jgi:ribonuclease R
VESIGGDGLVPVSTLGAERFLYDEASQSLTGEESGEQYRPGMRIKLRLAEANPVSGALRFELPEGGSYAPARMGRPTGLKHRGKHMVGKRGRPANIRHQGRKKR